MKPIETIYKGYRFRSRLEARWAIFFDTLGVTYSYEREGVDLDGLLYLPDFWLPEQNCYVEIKGGSPTEEEQEKAFRLAKATGKTVFIFWGEMPSPDPKDDPPMNQDAAWLHVASEPTPEEKEKFGSDGRGWDNCYAWCECPECHVVGIEFSGRAERLRHKDGCSVAKDPKFYSTHTPRLKMAYTAARQARFEHGEKGI